LAGFAQEWDIADARIFPSFKENPASYG